MLVGCMLSFGGCVTENRPDKNKEVEQRLPVTDTASYRIVHFKDFSPYFSGTDTQLDSTTFSARYPVFADDIDSLVKKAIFIDGEDNIEQVADSFLGGFNEYAEEQIERGDQTFHTWYKHQDCRVVLNIPGFLTLRHAINDYTGGAHGMELELWYNFDLHDRKQLALTDVVQDTSKLRALAETYFRKQESLDDTTSYGGAYFFEDNTFALAENFGMTAEGLLFHYNPYEIKSYAEGATTLLIPYSELKDILTDKGKAIQLHISTKN